MTKDSKHIAKEIEKTAFRTLKTLYSELYTLYWELDVLDASQLRQLNRMKYTRQDYRRDVLYSIRDRLPEVSAEIGRIKDWIIYEKSEIDRVREEYLDNSEYEDDDECNELYWREDEHITFI